MKTLKKTQVTRVFALLLAVLMVAMYSLPQNALIAEAKDAPWPDGTVVRYVNGAGDDGNKVIQDYDSGTPSFDAFCMNRHFNVSDSSTADAAGIVPNQRYFYNVTNTSEADPKIVNNISWNNKKPNPGQYPEVYTFANQEDAARGQLKRALYYGFVGKKGDLGITDSDDWYKATQIAVWQICHFGQGYMRSAYSGLQSVGAAYGNDLQKQAAWKLLVNYVFAMEGSDATGWHDKYPEANIPLNLYLGGQKNNYAADAYYQSLIAGELTEPPSEDDDKKGKLNTTVKADGKEGSTQKAARVDAAKAETLDNITDKIDYEDLVGGATYSVQGTLVEIGDSKEADNVITKSTPKDCVADASGSGSWEIEFTGLKGKLKPGKKYVVYESAKLVKNAQGEDVQDGATVSHENRDDLAQTVVVGGKLKTTVTAGGKSGSDSKAATLTAAEADKVTSVTDKIDYEGLTAGATYTVKGTLRDVTDSKDVATVSEEKKAEKADGTWEITFKDVKIQAGHKYVVYEEAANKDDPEDKAEHKDDKDLAQTIVVEPKEDTNKDENKGSDEEKKEDSATGNDTAVLSVSKTSDVEEAQAGDEVPYIITIKNTGTGNATGVKVRDIMGDHLEYVSDDSDGVHSGKNVDWTIDVPAGDSVEIEITCKIKASASGKIVNNVKIMNPDIFGSVTEDADKALVNLDGGDSDDTDNNNADDEDISGGDGDDTGSSDGVRTGDENSVMLWMTIALAALVMLAAAKKLLNK